MGRRTGHAATPLRLDPALPVLLRPDGRVQLGWRPGRAVLIDPPAGLTAAALAGLLRGLQAGGTLAELRTEAVRRGADPDDLAALFDALTGAGLLGGGTARPGYPACVRVHGRGPLAELITGALGRSGARVQHTVAGHATGGPGLDLVVLADTLVADPRVVRELHAAGVPHLPVRVRDGTGLVGPLVLPGTTSCLRCADLHRTDRDPAWPALAAQLLGTVGTADRATLLGTAALALREIERVLSGVAPPTLDTTLEFDVDRHSITARRWSRHPRCDC
ncbi:TOMM precursor leader peptide-binding protein [uncultured Mycolicibacterium sp.]|uniref:TOMM precursor leader peptide-binding protein n=1 Tax=uncultured Mycolicibacterium sp. TaxID=2320817 RepID=UPI0026186E5F|nr:TOMM precursor leader peptide-binding protein [uncultured Mycolicibacterium sp.]